MRILWGIMMKKYVEHLPPIDRLELNTEQEVRTSLYLRKLSMKIIISAILFLSAMLTTQVFAVCNSAITKPDSIYVDNSDGTVTDKQIGLMWQKCTLGLTGSNCGSGTAINITWQAALSAANNNTDNGFSDWRLPNKNELISLMDEACYGNAINTTLFPGAAGNYWSSSPYAGDNLSAWAIHLGNGSVSYYTKNWPGIGIRLVRDSY